MNILTLTLVILITEEGIININTRTVVTLSSTRTPGPPTSNTKTSASFPQTVYIQGLPRRAVHHLLPLFILKRSFKLHSHASSEIMLDVAHQRRDDVRGLGDVILVVVEPVGEDDLHECAALGDDPILVVDAVAWYANPGVTYFLIVRHYAASTSTMGHDSSGACMVPSGLCGWWPRPSLNTLVMGICGQRQDAGEDEVATRRCEKQERSVTASIQVRNIAGPCPSATHQRVPLSADTPCAWRCLEIPWWRSSCADPWCRWVHCR